MKLRCESITVPRPTDISNWHV